LEIVTEVRHDHPGATSNQVVRSVLGGRATGSFLGKVAVARHAQKTDAAQSVKAMLLDRTATANAKPELEIFADDVKCAHGATVGELDKAALFYMASRGIPPAEARRLMMQAFIADAFVSMEDDAEREAMEGRALAALEAMQ
jgi:Fe-S cluster assembly protein SufD